MSLTITTPTVRGKRLDLWVDLAGLEEGRELKCSSAKTFCAFLFSDSTKTATASSRYVGVCLELRLAGPTCDDGEPLRVSYKLTRDDWESLPAFVRGQTLEKLATMRSGPGFKDPEQAIRETFGGVS